MYGISIIGIKRKVAPVQQERRKILENMVLILKMLGLGCLIIVVAIALLILIAIFVSVFKGLTKKK